MRTLRPIASFVSWHRRWIGALLAVGAVLLTAQHLSTPPPTTAVVVLTAPVPPGHILTAADVAERQVPPNAVPAEALSSVDAAIGRPVAVGLSPGTIVQASLLATDAVEPGRSVVPILVADSQLRALLRPGNAITLVVVGGESAEVLTTDARVAAMPIHEPGSGLAVATTQTEGLVTVNVPTEQAATIAALGQSRQISIILGGG